jgi:hypothetical protein
MRNRSTLLKLVLLLAVVIALPALVNAQTLGDGYCQSPLYDCTWEWACQSASNFAWYVMLCTVGMPPVLCC